VSEAVIWLNLKSEQRFRAVSAHLQFSFLAIGLELTQKISVCCGKDCFQGFLAKGDPSPFDALHLNPISVSTVHSSPIFKKTKRVG
jgi:hypothetical protein